MQVANSPEKQLGQENRRPGGYIPTLDGWRGIAILMVMAAHVLQNLAHVLPIAQSHERLVRLTAGAGAHGVGFFFALSGFLIAYRLSDETDRTGKINLPSFFMRRCQHILPAAWVYLVILALFSVFMNVHISLADWITSALFCRNYLSGGSWWTGHLWALALEAHFYLLAPFIIIAIPRRRRILVLVVLCVGVEIWRLFLWRHQASPLFIGFFERTDTQIDQIFYGCILGLALREDRLQRKIATTAQSVVFLPALGIAYLATLLQKPSWPWYPLAWSILPIVTALLLIGTIFRPTCFLSQTLESWLLRQIGRISYSLYLWQQLFLGFGRSKPGWMPVWFVTSFLAALLSYYLLERPFFRRPGSGPTPANATLRREQPCL